MEQNKHQLPSSYIFQESALLAFNEILLKKQNKTNNQKKANGTNSSCHIKCCLICQSNVLNQGLWVLHHPISEPPPSTH